MVSNDPNYVNHFHSIFEELWKNGVDAEIRISSIEEGVDFEDIEVITGPFRAWELYLDFVSRCTKGNYHSVPYD